MRPSAVLALVKNTVEGLPPSNPSTEGDRFVLHVGTRQNSRAGRVGYLLAQPAVPVQPGRNCADRSMLCTLEFVYAIPPNATSVADLYAKALDDLHAVGNSLMALPGMVDVTSIAPQGGAITDDQQGELVAIYSFEVRFTA